jgi:hypothetical protein
MLAVFIFYIHVIFLAYVFTRSYIEGNLTRAFLSSIFIIVLFSVGWTFCEFVMGFFMESEGLSLLFPRAVFSLTLLTAIEIVFYRYYYTSKARTAFDKPQA